MAKRVDENQAQIVAELRQAYVCVTLIFTVGHGLPDLLCASALARPPEQNWLFEVKVDGGKLTPDEIEWHRMWPGQKAVIHNSWEALKIMGII